MGKYLLSILGLISLLWIGYVGINLTSLGQPLTPETVFGTADASVVIVHKPLEPDYTHPDFAFLAENEFYASILTHTERIQHFYFSSSRSIVLLERSKPWTTELIDRYFSSLSISTEFNSAKSFKLSNGWTASYDKEILVISKQPLKQITNAAIEWKYIDRKSSATVLKWSEGKPLIENAYRNSLSEILYISQSTTTKSALADDQETFQDIIPATFSELEFFEKSFLFSGSNSLKSPLSEWMLSGALKITYKGNVCIVTDCIGGQDPIAILGDRMEESSISSSKNSGRVRSTRIPSSLLSSSDWYIEIFNNRVFIATEKSTIDQLIGAYETGATLSQNGQLRTQLFQKAPKRVSYRKITTAEHRTISLLNHSTHTFVQRFATATIAQENPIDESEVAASIRIEGGISHIVPIQGTDFIYVLSKSNTLYGIKGDEEKWKVEIPSAVIGKPTLSYTENELIITTSNAVHQITKNGAELNGQAIALSTTPVTQAISYFWKDASQLAVLDNEKLTIYGTNGNQKSAIKTTFQPRQSAFIIWSNAGELTATILGKTTVTNFSIDRKKKLKSVDIPTCELIGVKSANGPVFFGINKQRLISVNQKGIITDLQLSKATSILSIDQSGKQLLLSIRCGNKISMITAEGKLLGTITPTFTDIAGSSIQMGNSGNSLVGILDGLANKNYIYTLNGKQLGTQTFDGSSIIVLHRIQNGTLMLISQSNNYLVRYPIDN